MSTPALISPESITAALGKAGIPVMCGRCLDMIYVRPDLDWIKVQFSLALAEQLKTLGLRYVAERFDCDKYARFAWGCAAVSHARTEGAPKAGLAFGIMDYLAQGRYGHEINFALCFNQPEPVIFYEPQQQKVVTLTEQEKDSCYGWLL